MPHLPELPEVPDTVPICDFMFDDSYRDKPIKDSWDPYVCGISGKSFSAQEQKDQVTYLSRSLAKEFGWKVNEGSEYDKVVGIFALNSVRVSISIVRSFH